MTDFRDQIAAHLREHRWDTSDDEALQLISTHARHNYHGLYGICRSDIRTIADAVMAVVQPALDAKDDEIDQRDTEIQDQAATIAGHRAAIAHRNRMTEHAADYVNTMAQDLHAQENWARQLYTAWWSARIGRAQARQEIKRLYGKLADANYAAAMALTDRDQVPYNTEEP